MSNGEIRDSDYQGRPWAVVRDIHGTRVGVRNLPRGHQVVMLVMVTAHPDTDRVGVFQAGEGVSLDAAAEAAVLKTLTSTTGAMLGYNVRVDVHQGGEHHHWRSGFEEVRDCGE